MEILNTTEFQHMVIPGRLSFPKHSLTVIVKGTFDLRPGQITTLSEEQLYPTGDEFYADDDNFQGSCFYESDSAYFKPQTDLLLTGKCYVPDAKPVPKCQVTFQVGTHSKSLAVIGDRDWRFTSSIPSTTEAEPFTEMELRYENSFGGEDYKNNPVGKGSMPITTQTGEIYHPLPNIEDPNDRVESLQRQPKPAGFGPLGRMWSNRFSKLGTYDDQWLEERWPWFPEDIDWSHFNAAQSDMQIHGYLKGDEDLLFENLHLTHPQYRSRLPGLRVRCFIEEVLTTTSENAGLREVSMNLDTLHVNMEEEQLILVWRGIVHDVDEELDTIDGMYIISESLSDVAQSQAYYTEEYKKCLKEQEEEWNPQAQQTEEEEEIVVSDEINNELAKADADMRAALLEAGINPDDRPVLTQEQLAEQARAFKEHGIELPEEEEPINRDIFVKRLNRGDSFAGEDLSELDLSNLNMPGVDLQHAILFGVRLNDVDLSGASLEGANLAKADLSGANMNQASLIGADLTEAKLTNVDLRDSDLREVIMEKANLDGINLEKCTASDAIFIEASLIAAKMRSSNFNGAEFSKCILHNANMSECKLQEANFDEAVGRNIDMKAADLFNVRAERCDFSGGCFKGVIAGGSTWEGAKLEETDFSYSDLEGSDFTLVSLEGANLYAANAKSARFVKANLENSRMVEMNLFEGSLEKAHLTGTDFHKSNLYAVEFLDSSIDGAKLDATNVKMTKLVTP